MKSIFRQKYAVLAVALAAAAAAFALTAEKSSNRSVTESGRHGYVVLLSDSVSNPEALATRHARRRSVELTHVYRSAIKGYAAVMSSAQADLVARDPAVELVEADQALDLAGETFVPSGPQKVPTHLRRSFAADTTAAACEEGSPNPKVNVTIEIDCLDAGSRVDVDVAVLDNGVDDTADLNVVSRVDCAHPDNPYGAADAPYVPPPAPEAPGYERWHPDAGLNEENESDEFGCLEHSGDPEDLSGYDANGFDGQGHGTATANRIGAIDNNIGTVGIAPGARIWNVKVRDEGISPQLSEPVISSGLVAAYSFDEGSGSTTHDSASDHDGTIEGASWSASGKYGAALDFDGSNDLVRVADATDLDLISSFTLEAWVRPDSFGSARPMITKTESSGGHYKLSATSAGKPTGILSNGTSSVTATGLTSLPTNAWSHIALTSDGTTMRLYVDGQLAASPAAIAPTANGAELQIGHNPVTGADFDGLIDELRIYDETLSQAQIEDDRETPVGYAPGLAMSTLIAGVDWVNQHADQIEVANLSIGCKLPWEGPPAEDPLPNDVACSSGSGEVLNAAIDATVEKGVVFVAAAGNQPQLNSSEYVAPQNNPNVISVSVAMDCDGVPSLSGEPKACSSGYEDTRSPSSSFGENVTMAAPFSGPATSGATPQVAGAAAILASECDPDSVGDVQAIMDALVAEGNTASRVNGGWDDTADDGRKEALLDVSDEEVFDPIMVGEEQAPMACMFKNTPRFEAESYPAGIDGAGSFALTTPAGTFSCEATSLQGDLSGHSKSLALDPTATGCKHSAGPNVTFTPKSCHLTLAALNEGPPYKGSLDVACTTSGDGIVLSAIISGSTWCKVTIWPQQGLTGIKLANEKIGEGPERYASLDAALTGVAYELKGGCIGNPPQQRTDGVLDVEATLEGEDEAEGQVGVFLSGEELP